MGGINTKEETQRQMRRQEHHSRQSPTGAASSITHALPKRTYFKFASSYRTGASFNRPASVDLRRTTCFPYVPARDQGEEGSCVSYSMGAAVECAQRRKRIGIDAAWDPKADDHFTRAFAAATSNDGQYGGVWTAGWLGSSSNTSTARDPQEGITFSEAVSAFGVNSAVKSFWLVPDLETLKECIYSGYPFVFGFTVTERMRAWQESEILQRASGYMLPEYNPASDVVDGYHAVLAVGYDDAQEAFLVRNSWGEDWGDDGHFWFPYKTMTSLDIVQDVIVIDIDIESE